MVQSVLLAMLMLVGQVLPAHSRECGGCLMGQLRDTQVVAVVPVSSDAPSACERSCCCEDEAGKASAVAGSDDSDSSATPCGRKDCNGGCKCPGACCANVQLVAVARVMSFDLGVAGEASPVPVPEMRVSARDAQLGLLRPPRA